MRFSTAILAAAAFTGFANAVEFTNSVFNNVTAGQSFTITWANATGPVTITLKNGPPSDLKTVATVGSGLSGGSTVYQVPSTLVKDTYAFEIKDSSPTPNYSPQFELIGGAAATTTASSTPTAAANNTQTTASASPTATLSRSSNTTATRSPSQSGTRSASGTPSPTTAPSSAMALTSNFALVFLFVGALMTIN